MEGKRAQLLLQPTACVSFVSIVYYRSILGMKEPKVLSLSPLPTLDQSKLQEHKSFSLFIFFLQTHAFLAK